MPKNVNVLRATDHIVGAVSIVESTIVIVSTKKHCLLLICHVYSRSSSVGSIGFVLHNNLQETQIEIMQLQPLCPYCSLILHLTFLHSTIASFEIFELNYSKNKNLPN
jgi:hypothetical protein